MHLGKSGLQDEGAIYHGLSDLVISSRLVFRDSTHGVHATLSFFQAVSSFPFVYVVASLESRFLFV